MKAANRGVLALAGLLLACQSGPPAGAPEGAPEAAPEAPVEKTRFEPARGIVCDRSTQLCSYRGGPSVGLTRLFFGEAAGAAIDGAQRRAAYPHDPFFKPEPWVGCDTLVTTCYTGGGPSDEHTRRYFGRQAGALLEARSTAARGSGREIIRYGQYVSCDALAGACYDRLGAGYGATRLYLGKSQADFLLRRLQPWGAEAPTPGG